MTAELRFDLAPSAEQAAKLERLQQSFADVCNALAPVVQERRLWHRVTLHHLMYHQLREEFPALGSQMVCNAIHSVCRNARRVYQDPASPYQALGPGAPLPLLRFSGRGPVMFDRHTLSIREGTVSLYTLEGRIRCAAPTEAAQARLRDARLREIELRRGAATFELAFRFAPGAGPDDGAPTRGAIPEYIEVQA